MKKTKKIKTFFDNILKIEAEQRKLNMAFPIQNLNLQCNIGATLLGLAKTSTGGLMGIAQY